MVAPVVIGAAISAGANLLGGLFGRKDSRRQEDLQREFAQHGIRWRVEDAKAAGVHPLYALGAQATPYTPIASSPMGDALSAAGQNIGSAVAAQKTAQERAHDALGLALLQSQIEESDARKLLYLSEAARNSQAASSSATFPLQEGGPVVVGELDAPDVMRGMTEVVTTQMPTRSASASYLQAGTPPGLREYEMPGGLRVLLPATSSGDSSEAFESLESPITALAVLGANLVHYGEKGIRAIESWARRHGSASARENIRDYRRQMMRSRTRYRTGGSF